MKIVGMLISAVIFLISLTVHEMSHGYAAYLMGDNTAKHMGRLSFNPLRHVDIIGFLMMLVAGFGWAKPVPINMNNFKDPKKGMALSALAGPAANIVLAFVAAILLKLFANVNVYLQIILQSFLYVNCMFAMFNLIPIPPLDGSKVLFALLPTQYYYRLMYLERYGFIILILIINLPVFNHILANGIYNLQTAINRIVDLLPI